MDYFNIYVYFIVLVKICFIVSALYLRVLERQNNKDISRINTLKSFKENLQFIFVISISILLILLFSPFTNKTYFPKVFEPETRMLLFLYGIIMIIEADWSTFFSDVKNKK